MFFKLCIQRHTMLLHNIIHLMSLWIDQWVEFDDGLECDKPEWKPKQICLNKLHDWHDSHNVCQKKKVIKQWRKTDLSSPAWLPFSRDQLQTYFLNLICVQFYFIAVLTLFSAWVLLFNFTSTFTSNVFFVFSSLKRFLIVSFLSLLNCDW